MSVQKRKKPRVPGWAWLFAAVCLLIPVLTIGGAIPTGIGVGGAVYCLAVSRGIRKTTGRKLVHCLGATAACWALFLGVVGGTEAIRINYPGPLETKHRQQTAGTQDAESPNMGQFASKPLKSVLSDEAKRREIYARAISMRQHLERAKVRRSELQAKGLDLTVVDKQIEHIKKMHEKRLDFTCRFYDITKEQLQEIIAEGDRKRWPTD